MYIFFQNYICDFSNETNICDNCSPGHKESATFNNIFLDENKDAGTSNSSADQCNQTADEIKIEYSKTLAGNLNKCPQIIPCKDFFNVLADLLALYADMKIIFHTKIVDGGANIDHSSLILNACKAFSYRYKDFAVNVVIKITRCMLGVPILKDLFE